LGVFLCPYIETSVKEGVNVNVCFDMLVRELICHHMGFKVECLVNSSVVPSDFCGFLYNFDEYIGEIQNGVRHGVGLGLTHLENGEVENYLGEWVDSKKCGFGFLSIFKGRKSIYHFAGDFQDDREVSKCL